MAVGPFPWNSMIVLLTGGPAGAWLPVQEGRELPQLVQRVVHSAA
jgi:hypothetical protein